MYDVTGYKNTGFNVENIPDSISLIMSNDSIDLPSTDIMQNEHLTSLTIFSNWEDIKDVDYIQISDAFYFVTNIQMTSADVCILSLSYDAFTSCGGVDAIGSALQIIDGTASRACVASDLFGEWTAEEPFTPNAPLTITEGALIGDDGGNNTTTLIVSTVDLSDTSKTATTYTDSATQETVTVPSLKNAGGSQIIFMDTPTGTQKSAIEPATRYYDGTNATVLSNVQRARENGLDGGILGQYTIPNAYCSSTFNADGLCTNLKGTSSTKSSGLNFNYATVNNKKCLYGKLNKYLLVSLGSGNSAEFNPEDINDGNASPSFSVFVDARYQQRPYCRPSSYLGDSSNLYMQAVAGQDWADAPLRYTSKSGSNIDRVAYESDRTIQAQRNQWASIESAGIKAGGGLGSTIMAGAKGLNRLLGGGLNNILASTGTISRDVAEYSTWGDIQKTQAEQQYEGYKSALNFVSGQIQAPSIQFPRSDTMRDYFGNGFKIYRYRPNDTDLKRYDRFLTMYGYALNKPLEKNDFINRQYFNFVLCSDVSFAGSAPRWKREAVAQQLANGVRIWHTSPNPSYYTSGNPVA